MIKEFLKIAGVKNEKQFYNKYPSEVAFFKAHPEAKHLKSMKKGGEMKKLEQLTDFGNPPIAKDGEEVPKYQVAPAPVPMNSSSINLTMGTRCPAGQQKNPFTGACEPIPSFGGTGTPGLSFNPNQQGFIRNPTTGKYEQPAKMFGGADAASSKTGLLDKLGGWQGVGQLAGGIIQGIQGEKNWKEQKKASEAAKNISALTLRASRSRPNEPLRRYYNRPEDQIINPDELFPTYGVGSNVLSSAEDGAMIRGNPTEIQNMYNPGDIYSDLGYEPMDESDIVKQYEEGGYVRKAQLGNIIGQMGGVSGILNQAGGLTGTGANTSGLYSSIGNVASKLVPGGAGAALGGFGALAQFAINDQRARTLKNNAEATQRNLQQAGFESGIQGLQGQYASFMKNGGSVDSDYEWLSHTWQPQVITKFGDVDVSQIHSIATEGMDTLRTGGRITQNNIYETDQFNFGGELQTTWGGRAEPISYNPYLPGSGETVMFEGNSHEEKDNKGRTGIGVKYGNDGDYSPYMEYGRDGIEDVTDVEVERGEPATELQDSTGDTSMVVFGNLKIPNHFLGDIGDPNAKGKKFKHYAKDLSKKEAKQNKIIDKATQLIKIHDDDKLVTASVKAMIYGAHLNLQNIAQFKQNAATVQNAINDTAEEYGIDADALAKGKIKVDKEAMQEQAKFGKVIQKAQKGATADKDVDIDKSYDPEFANSIGFMVDYEQEGSSAGPKGYVGGGSNWGTNNPKIKSRKQAIDYYYKNYWPMVKDLPKGLRTRAFQLAINTGDPYGEMLVASGKMSVADRQKAIREAESKGLEGLDKNKYVLNKRLKENKDDIGATVDMFKADPATYMVNLDLEQYRYYNKGLNNGENPQEMKDFHTGYYQSVGDIANKYAGIDKSTAKTTTDKTTAAVQNKTAIQTKKDEVKAEVPQEESVDQETADRLNNMLKQAKAEKDKTKKKKLVEDFQKEFHKYFPEKAKEIILKDKDVTRKGKSMGIKSIDDLKKKDVKTILETNEDGIPGDRTDQYNAIAQASVKKESTKIPEDIPLITSEEKKEDEITPKTVQTQTKKKSSWLEGLNTLLPYLQRPYQETLDMSQLYPEMMALSMNTLEPVKAQGVQPLLETPYDISFQDQLNEITAAERAAQKMSMGDPSALANIAAQSQAAKSKVLAEQFRANQAMKAGVYGRNRETLNQAQLQNLQIFADQEAKQQLAKSKTKSTALEAMESMSDKIAKQKLENRTLNVLEQAFPNYRFGRDMRFTPSQLTFFDTEGTGVPSLATPPYVSSGRTASSTTSSKTYQQPSANSSVYTSPQVSASPQADYQDLPTIEDLYSEETVYPEEGYGRTMRAKTKQAALPSNLKFTIGPNGMPIPVMDDNSKVPNLQDVFSKSFKTEKNGGITKKKHFNGSIVRALKNI